MALKKIVSGGASGAERAALDIATNLNIPYSGWVPKNREMEDGVLPQQYALRVMDSGQRSEQIERNISEAEGTLILTHGKLQDETKYVREIADKHQKSCLHIDLRTTSAFRAADTIHAWLASHEVSVLNVTGSTPPEDPQIYDAVKDILEAVIYLNLMEVSVNSPLYTPDSPEERSPSNRGWPRSVAQAVQRLKKELPLKDRVTIANMTRDELEPLNGTLGNHIRNAYGIEGDNQELVESCCAVAETDYLQKKEASAIIIRRLWKELRATHRLRRVK